jgi:hypothetical protein
VSYLRAIESQDTLAAGAMKRGPKDDDRRRQREDWATADDANDGEPTPASQG